MIRKSIKREALLKDISKVALEGGSRYTGKSGSKLMLTLMFLIEDLVRL